MTKAKWNTNKPRSFGTQLSPSFNPTYDIDIVIQLGAMQKKTMRFQTPESTHWVINSYVYRCELMGNAEGTNLFIRYLVSLGIVIQSG